MTFRQQLIRDIVKSIRLEQVNYPDVPVTRELVIAHYENIRDYETWVYEANISRHSWLLLLASVMRAVRS